MHNNPFHQGWRRNPEIGPGRVGDHWVQWRRGVRPRRCRLESSQARHTAQCSRPFLNGRALVFELSARALCASASHVFWEPVRSQGLSPIFLSRQPFVPITISEQKTINGPNGPSPAVAIAEAISIGQAAKRSRMVVHADRLAGKFLGHIRRNIVLQ